MWSNTVTLLCFGLIFIILPANTQDKFSDNEKQNIEKLQKLTGKLDPEYLNEEFVLGYFLRDRDMNIKDAHTKIKESVVWRKENKIAQIDEEKILPDLFPYRFEGIDKLGRPIIYVAPARWDIRKVVLAGQRDQLIRLWAQLVERSMQKILETRKSNPIVTQAIMIMDLHGYNLRQHACLQCFPVYFDWVAVYEKNYPQILGAFYMINTPRIFQPLLQLLRGVFSPHLRSILKVLGPNKQEWTKEILSVVDESQLLKFYGGSKE